MNIPSMTENPKEFAKMMNAVFCGEKCFTLADKVEEKEKEEVAESSTHEMSIEVARLRNGMGLVIPEKMRVVLRNEERQNQKEVSPKKSIVRPHNAGAKRWLKKALKYDPASLVRKYIVIHGKRDCFSGFVIGYDVETQMYKLDNGDSVLLKNRLVECEDETYVPSNYCDELGATTDKTYENGFCCCARCRVYGMARKIYRSKYW